MTALPEFRRMRSLCIHLKYYTVSHMKVLSLVSQKGGVGKTTLATALAVAAQQDGKRPVVIDLDPQASASFWRDTRQDDSLAVSAIPASRLGPVLKAAGEAGAELAIID